MHTPVTRRTTAAVFVRTVVLALLAAFAVAGLAAGPAHAEDGTVAWTVRTASNSYGADRSSFSYTVNPGGKVEDTMVVANHGKDPLRLTVYAADGFTTDSRGSTCSPRTRSPSRSAPGSTRAATASRSSPVSPPTSPSRPPSRPTPPPATTSAASSPP